MEFVFDNYNTKIFFSREIKKIENIDTGNTIVIADENTFPIAKRIFGEQNIIFCRLKSGEENKNWQSVETIIKTAENAGLGRDGLFIGVGGGLIGDLAGFAASIYMRGCKLILVSTTLLAMADASIGGKTGFNISGIKNLVGSFYPAREVIMPLECLASLAQREWKSGFAELIKTSILCGDDFMEMLADFAPNDFSNPAVLLEGEKLFNCIKKAAVFKGEIVSEDMHDFGKRAILNLGHTFGHALEAASGFNITHGEAVAWGIYQSCLLGSSLGITPRRRAEKIKSLLESFGYDCSSPHPLAASPSFKNAFIHDKKKKQNMTFIIPDEKSARAVTVKGEEMKLAEKILYKGPKK
ncbi:MAG: 3-dehydroquinate synthase [Treponema sp.]|jgi:3-dehydroquinate synthase|nr:3-dehydroquinate synthase [Treponema sp.]